jgi:glucose-1-phosphate cytidylyltransferase
MKNIKAVILAGGLGTRLSEETNRIPKPMVEIGNRPIIWHIMKSLSYYGIKEFVICCGYKGYVIKEYFSNYFLHNSDLTVNLEDNSIEILEKRAESWKIHLVDTGDETLTGGRMKRIKDFVKDDEYFCFTYGDGLADINIKNLIDFHKQNSVLATLSAVSPPGRFGALDIDDGLVSSFVEKPMGDNARINGGFFVLSPKVIDYIKNDHTIWEREPLEKLSSEGQLAAYKHDGFWHPMDTLRDKIYLEDLWNAKKAPWKTW